MSTRSVLQGLLGLLIGVLTDIKETMADDQARRAILLDLGLNPPTSGTPTLVLDEAKLRQIAAYVDTQDPSMEGFVESLEHAAALIDAIRALIRAAGAGSDQATGVAFELLMQMYLSSHMRHALPEVYWTLRLLGAIEEVYGTQVSTELRLERIGQMITSGPVRVVTNSLVTHDDALLFSGTLGFLFLLAHIFLDVDGLVGWDPAPTSPTPVGDQLSRGAITMALGDDLRGTIIPIPKDHGGRSLYFGLGVNQQANLGGGAEREIPIGSGWVCRVAVGMPGVVDGIIPMERGAIAKAGSSGDLYLRVRIDQETGDRVPWVVGDARGTRIEMGGFGFMLEVGTKRTGMRLQVRNAALIVDGRDGDGFINQILSAAKLRVDLNIVLGYDWERGFYLEGGTGLQVMLPINKTFQGFEIKSALLGLSIGANGASFRPLAALAFSLKLGPLTATVEQLGYRFGFDWTPNGSGNLGPFDVSSAFKPPSGVGLAIDTGTIVGGGYLYFDTERHEYGGIVQLEIKGVVTLKAIGIINTKLPDGRPGFSMLLVISGEGFSPVQLGFGFMLTGVGGLVGIHRSVHVEALQAGVKNRTLDAIMFPKDPIRNAPQIISALRTVFPPTQDRYTFGFMFMIQWGVPALFKINLGLIIEMPKPVRLAILGQLKAHIPAEKLPLIKLNMDMVGIIDFEKSRASVDAVLYDSEVVGFVLTGGMALRIGWGKNPNFALSVGGFHPRFEPPPGFPSLDRVSLTLASGNNPRLRCSFYLAVTSNTLQVGASLDLYAKAAGFSVQGWLYFDALFQFSPFKFIVGLGAGVALKRGSTKLMVIRLSLELSGPAPWSARGSASFKILFVSFKVGFKVSWGKAKSEPSTVVNALEELKAALADPRNWDAQLPATGHALVTLRETQGAPVVLVHPLGTVSVRQRVLPFNVEITRLGNARIDGPRQFKLTEVRLENNAVAASPIKDQFAPAQYFDLTEDQKLSRPSFEQMQAGAHMVSDQIIHSVATEADLTYETLLIDRKDDLRLRLLPYRPTTLVMQSLAGIGSARFSLMRRSGGAKFRSPGPQIGVAETAYTVVRVNDLTKVGGFAGLTYTEALQAMTAYQVERPAERGFLQVVAEHEVVK